MTTSKAREVPMDTNMGQANSLSGIRGSSQTRVQRWAEEVGASVPG